MQRPMKISLKLFALGVCVCTHGQQHMVKLPHVISKVGYVWKGGVQQP